MPLIAPTHTRPADEAGRYKETIRARRPVRDTVTDLMSRLGLIGPESFDPSSLVNPLALGGQLLGAVGRRGARRGTRRGIGSAPGTVDQRAAKRMRDALNKVEENIAEKRSPGVPLEDIQRAMRNESASRTAMLPIEDRLWDQRLSLIETLRSGVPLGSPAATDAVKTSGELIEEVLRNIIETGATTGRSELGDVLVDLLSAFRRSGAEGRVPTGADFPRITR
jgi:hypothetical protein